MNLENVKLTVELVPATCWYTNVRTNVSKSTWDILRKECYRRAAYHCEICGDTGRNQGRKHDVECHEIWQYDEERFIQKLDGLIALCPLCHKVKHAGLAEMRGELKLVTAHLMRVNKYTLLAAHLELESALIMWMQRSQHHWTLDITFIEQYLEGIANRNVAIKKAV